MNHRAFSFLRLLGVIIIMSIPLTIVFLVYLDISPPITATVQKPEYFQNTALSKPLDFIEKTQIYVVSLAGRGARRADMEILRGALGLQWEYFDAIYIDNTLIGRILHWVERVRSTLLFPSQSADTNVASGSEGNGNGNGDGDNKADIIPFWPEHIEDIAHSNQEIPLLDSLIWELPISRPPYQPLSCNEFDFHVLDQSVDETPEHMRLTSGRVACWYSHLSVLHLHANTLPSASGKGSIALILEDDVDMERDIVQQMESLWNDLPDDWDMVFLGHCWSDETRGRLMSTEPDPPSTNGSFSSGSRMYASTGPKCTHAYAVSRIGARRLLLHLTHPPFAYSRAIDQAYAWLIESGRIKSFSVVPNLAMQRKVMVSDVMEGGTVNNLWKDTLIDGVFDSLMDD